MKVEFATWRPCLSREDVLSFLYELQELGFVITYGRLPAREGWTIAGPHPTQWVAITPTDNLNYWDVRIGNLGKPIGTVSSMRDLRGYVAQAMSIQGMSINEPPTQVKFESKKPAANLGRLATMIGSTKVVSIWDGYVNNVALLNLASLSGLGAKFSDQLRILTDNKQTKSASLTQEYFNNFRTDVAPGASLRGCEKEHDRFMVLDDGRCLSPDLSLNKISNRGTVNLVKDATQNKDWFELEWAKGSSWPL